MAYDPLIGRPVIGEPNPELKRPAPQQNAMLAFVAMGYVVLVLACLYSLIGE
jgi:hypothetical protein